MDRITSTPDDLMRRKKPVPGSKRQLNFRVRSGITLGNVWFVMTTGTVGLGRLHYSSLITWGARKGGSSWFTLLVVQSAGYGIRQTPLLGQISRPGKVINALPRPFELQFNGFL